MPLFLWIKNQAQLRWVLRVSLTSCHPSVGHTEVCSCSVGSSSELFTCGCWQNAVTSGCGTESLGPQILPISAGSLFASVLVMSRTFLNSACFL